VTSLMFALTAVVQTVLATEYYHKGDIFVGGCLTVAVALQVAVIAIRDYQADRR
jgi:hypothetical protein